VVPLSLGDPIAVGRRPPTAPRGERLHAMEGSGERLRHGRIGINLGLALGRLRRGVKRGASSG
jgi:hypothetical protein